MAQKTRAGYGAIYRDTKQPDGFVVYHDATQGGMLADEFGGPLAVPFELIGERPADHPELEEGFHPISGAPLRQNAGKTESDGKGRRPISGVDKVLSARKEFSLAIAIAPEKRDELIHGGKEVFHAAAESLLERSLSSRVGKGGTKTVPVQGLYRLTIEFENRAGEIHLHAHVLVYNFGRRPNGTFGAIEWRRVFQDFSRADALVSAGLAGVLEKAGFDVVRLPNGRWTVSGLEELVPYFSSRTEEIERVAAERGVSDDYSEKRKISAAIRPGKPKERSLDEVVAEVGDVLDAKGFDLAEVRDRAFGKGRALAPDDRGSSGFESLGDAAVLEVQSPEGFTRGDLDRAVAALAPGRGLGVPEILSLSARLLRAGRFVSEGLGAAKRYFDRGEREKAHEAIAREGAVLSNRLARALGTRAVGKAGADTSDETREALRGLSTERSALKVLTGTGPNRDEAFLAAVEAYRRSGFRVVGVTKLRKEAEALRAKGLTDVVTAAKAMKEWQASKFRPFRRPPLPYRHPGTDRIQDVLGAWAGAYSDKRNQWAAYQRDRYPLDLSRGRVVLVVQDADALWPEEAAAILAEARQKGAAVFLAGDIERPGWFARLAHSHPVISVAPAVHEVDGPFALGRTH